MKSVQLGCDCCSDVRADDDDIYDAGNNADDESAVNDETDFQQSTSANSQHQKTSAVRIAAQSPTRRRTATQPQV